MRLFDLGAHFGFFSLVVARYYGTAIAVDPSPVACRMIQRQISLNNCSERIQVLQVAVSDSTQLITMVASGVFSDGYFKVDHERPPGELTTSQSTTIDVLSRQFGAPTHIKVDVEGHEASVLRGARETLSSSSPLLFLELHNEMVHSDGGNPTEVLDELERSGYRIFDANESPIEINRILATPICRILARKAV